MLKAILNDALNSQLQSALGLQVNEGDAEYAQFSATGFQYELRLLQADQVYLIKIDGAKREFVNTYPVANLAGYLQIYAPEPAAPTPAPATPEPEPAPEPAGT